jgi:hypothetical protein
MGAAAPGRELGMGAISTSTQKATRRSLDWLRPLMSQRSLCGSTFRTRRSTRPWLCVFTFGFSVPLEEDKRRKTCSRPVCVDFGGAGVYGASPSGLEPCWRTAFLAGVTFGTENSAGFGDVVIGCGGL